MIYFSTVIPADPVTNLSCLESNLKVTVNSPHLLALRVNFPVKVPIDDTLKNRDMTCKSVLRADMIFVVALLFYVHGKHLRSSRDGQLT